MAAAYLLTGVRLRFERSQLCTKAVYLSRAEALHVVRRSGGQARGFQRWCRLALECSTLTDVSSAGSGMWGTGNGQDVPAL